MKPFSEITPLLLMLTFLLAGCGSPEQPGSLLRRARERSAAGDDEEAIRILCVIPREAAEWPDARLQLGRLCALRKRESEAIEYLNEVPQDGSKSAVAAATYLAEIHMKACRLSLAAAAYRQVLTNSPGDNTVRSLLATLLVISGQRRNASQLLMELLEQDAINLKDTVLLSQPERRPPETEHLLSCPVNGQSDAWTLYAKAMADLEGGRRNDAVRKLEESVKLSPDYGAAQAMLGELILDESQAEFVRWIRSLPGELRTDPDVCYVAGMWYQQKRDTTNAARCFWETVRQDPLHRRAIFQLGQCLAHSNAEKSQLLLNYAKQMEDFSRTMERVLNKSGTDSLGFQSMIETLVAMGRVKEARNWLRLDNNRHGTLRLSDETQIALKALDMNSPGRILEGKAPALHIELSDRALPDFLLASDAPATATKTNLSIIKFHDDALNADIRFSYLSGHEGTAHSIRVFESTGGGTGVIDYDNDGHPDLFLTQGERWPLKSRTPEPSPERDSLFRQRYGRFSDVSVLAGLDDDSYGQGVCSADFNNDGLADLYVANIGCNRLLLNNGDGTFSDCSGVAGLSETAWTTSCLMLDLNSDGNPDLYDVNYLKGDDVLHVECGDNRCSVSNFAGAPDSVLLSKGNGTFTKVPDACPTTTPKGLGIASIPPDSGIQPMLFVANDQVPNFCLRWNNNRYEDEALLRGLAVNYLGRPTACMGIASGDVNNDGQLDLFVTNFEGEANCLYLQTQPGFFSDAIQGSGLMQAGVPLVGWGTQFLDADNDSDLDLVVANGHVGDFRDGGYYRMPLQVFQNNGDAHFDELDSKSAGAILGQPGLWRSLAVIDWNTDGKLDFAVSAVDSPMALVTNQTDSQSSWIRLSLSGVQSARDASGARVEFETDSGRYWRHVSAGDGFQCSNERVVHFGFPRGESLNAIRVFWPSGRRTVLPVPDVNRQYYVREDQERTWNCPR